MRNSLSQLVRNEFSQAGGGEVNFFLKKKKRGTERLLGAEFPGRGDEFLECPTKRRTEGGVMRIMTPTGVFPQ